MLYISDTYNHRIRTITNDGNNIINTVAGNGKTDVLHYPHGIFVTLEGVLYIADTNNNRIRKLDPENGNLTTVVGTNTGNNNINKLFTYLYNIIHNIK